MKQTVMRQKIKKNNKWRGGKFLAVGILTAGFFSVTYFGLPSMFPIYVEKDSKLVSTPEFIDIQSGALWNIDNNNSDPKEEKENKFIAIHIKTPNPLKAIYMTSWVAGTPSFRDKLIKIADETEINSIVIDIKDYTGKIAFEVNDPLLQKIGAAENRIPNIRQFIKNLHDKDIYVIGRISVFQDPYFALKYHKFAVKRESDGKIWKDYKGIVWLDVASKDVWDYMIALAKEAYSVGFDELNFDYVRFPSDGDMNDIYYPYSEEKILNDPYYGKAEALRDFFKYLHSGLKDSGAVLSVDLFGMVTTNPDDLNVGQMLEYAEPYFDYISPMVYPSHYPSGFNGWPNPNKEVYGVVLYSLERAVERMLAASSSPRKIRPWLQDFDYGGNYDIAEIRAQIQAVYDSGLTSWMLWDPSNIYTREALLNK